MEHILSLSCLFFQKVFSRLSSKKKWESKCKKLFYGILLIQRSSGGTTFDSGRELQWRERNRHFVQVEVLFFIADNVYTTFQVKVYVTMFSCAVKSPSHCKGRGAGKVQQGFQKHIHDFFKLKPSATYLEPKTTSVQPLRLFLKRVGS